jgi:hypothetical protein
MVRSIYIQVCTQFFGLLGSNSPKIAQKTLKKLRKIKI